jgi:acyl carrier protein
MFSRDLCQRFVEAMPHSRLMNLYGMSEVAADAAWYDTSLTSHASLGVPIGRPITNTHIYLLDRYLQPVPVGVPGEIHIGGAGLARGYLNRPALTAEKFIPHPFSAEPGVRLYKTGDRARYLPDGNIECLGRIDYQVQIRGFRVELGEIESMLEQHPAIRQAIVIAREDVPGDTRLVAYCVAQQEPVPTVSTLRGFLQAQLPDHMIPTAFMWLEAMPRTPSGKVDRRALPVPDRARPPLEDVFAAPRTPWEMLLAEIWQEVLTVDEIGVYDNFFDLGGHSLLSMRVIASIEKRTGLRLNPRELIFQTLGQLASACAARVTLPQTPPPVRCTSRVWQMLKRVFSRRAGENI